VGAGSIPTWKRFAPVPIGGTPEEVFARLFAALRTQALADRIRWPLWLPVAMGAGIGLYFSLPEEPAWGFAVMAAGLALAAGTLAGTANRTAFRIALALVAAASLGFGVVKLRTELVRAPVLARNGPYAVWLGPPLRVETVEGERGHRPWSMQAKRRPYPPPKNPRANFSAPPQWGS
jgi:competence protein ComEC